MCMNNFTKLKILLIAVFFLGGLQSSWAQIDFEIGSGTTTSNSNTISPFTTFFEDGRRQMLFKASELIAEGATAGEISAIALDVTFASATPTNWTVGVKFTSDTVFSAFAFESGFTTTFTGSVTAAAGWTPFNFTSPIIWNGTDNIIIEMCYDNSVFTGNSTVRYTAVGFNSNRYAYTDGSNGCILNSFGFNANRANMRFTFSTPAGTYSVTDASCNGAADGGWTATVAGGVSPYTYLWSNGVTTLNQSGLSAGDYTVTITDANGLNGIDTVTVGEPTAVAANEAVNNNVSCNSGNDGEATAVPTGGTSPYTYLWSNAATSATNSNLTAGSYTVTVTDANGCTGTGTVSISEPTALVATATTTQNVSCNGGNDGAITASASGGTGSYTYLWSNAATTASISSLTAGTYTVTITDANGCTDVATETVTEPTAVSASIGAQTNVDCFGNSTGSLTGSATGGTGAYTYLWSNAGTSATISSLAAGVYTLTVTDANGCTGTTNGTITEPTTLNATITSQTNVDCNGSSTGSLTVTASGGTPAYTYLWSNAATTATAGSLAAGAYTVTVTDANGCTAIASATITEPTALSATISSSTNVDCNGNSTGSATVSASGGTTSYTYLWSNAATTATASSLPAGAYTVTVTDANGCTATANVTLTEPNPLVANATLDNDVSCNGFTDGGATASATGGTGAYTYLWSNAETTAAITNQGAGTYTVTVTDANGCTSVASVSISQPTALGSSITSQTNVACNGGASGAATVAATGGTTPYTYLWSNAATTAIASSLMAGNYSVTVTDANGCTSTSSVTITEPSALSSTITSQTNVACNGDATGSATVSVSGGTTAYTYAWSSGGTAAVETGLGAGTYSVTITDANGCTDLASVTITEPTALSATISSQTNVDCNGSSTGAATVTASGGTPSYTYAWSSGGTGAIETGLAAGTYTVTVTDANGCTETASLTITEPTAVVASITSQTNVSCFGNNSGSATAAATGGTGSYTYLWSTAATTMTINSLSAGTYTVTITDANGCTGSISVTITQPTAISASITSQTNVDCNGNSTGSATVTATGGTPNYTYAWISGGTSATENNLGAGTYTVTVTDANGCQDIATVTITEPTALTATITSQTDVDCNGNSTGSATVSASGGTTSYTYAWSSGGTAATATGLAAGAHTVTVTDANGCTTTAMATITEPTALVATATVDSNVTCSGFSNGGATASGSGGTGAYTYLWSNAAGTASITGVAAGSYTVTITDANGCTDVTSVNITEPTTLNATITAQTNVDCNGNSTGSATVSASGGTTSYTYAWSSGGTAATATGLAAGAHTVTVTDANGCTATTMVTITEPTALTLTVNTTDVTSNGATDGSATATVGVGTGTSPYTYNWSNGGTGSIIVNLAAGPYTVTVTDANGCTIVSNGIVGEPGVLLGLINSTDVSCNGGSDGTATSLINGGVSPYMYAWSNGQTTSGINGLSAGVYTLTVTDGNGITITLTDTISEPDSISVNLSSMDPLCFNSADGWATAAPTGGTMPYTYLWNLGFTTDSVLNLGPGTFVVTVTDANGCTALDSVTISQPTQLSATATSVNVNCSGGNDGEVSVVATGGTTGYTYLWSTTATTATVTGLSEGTYSVTVTDANGCTTVASVPVIAINQSPSLDLGSATDTICEGFSYTIVGPTGNLAYEWSDGSTNPDLTVTNAGTYSLTITDGNGCTASDSITLISDPCVSVPEANTLLTGVKVFPNPSDGLVNLEFSLTDPQDLEIRVLHPEGRLVHAAKVGVRFSGQREELNLEHLAQGLYFIQLNNGKQTAVLRVMVL